MEGFFVLHSPCYVVSYDSSIKLSWIRVGSFHLHPGALRLLQGIDLRARSSVDLDH